MEVLITVLELSETQTHTHTHAHTYMVLNLMAILYNEIKTTKLEKMRIFSTDADIKLGAHRKVIHSQSSLLADFN